MGICEREECLIKHDGKMVWEVRPRVAWDKGKALTYLRNALLKELEGQGFTSDQVYTIYIGDDVTDEDAFMEINEELKVSAAKFSLRETSEVLKFLTKLHELGDKGE